MELNETLIPQFDYPLQVIRSKARRKTIGIEVRQGAVIVRAPISTPDASITRILEEKRSWIAKALQNAPTQSANSQAVIPASLWYRGRSYPLVMEPSLGNTMSVLRTEDQICLKMTAPIPEPAIVRAILQRWYKREASIILPRELERLASRLGYRFNGVRIKDQKSRWGSCSTQGNINLNWRLIMAPQDVAHYVMVHELCHLKEMNHSPAFWTLVESAMPDYNRHREWLRQEALRILTF